MMSTHLQKRSAGVPEGNTRAALGAVLHHRMLHTKKRLGAHQWAHAYMFLVVVERPELKKKRSNPANLLMNSCTRLTSRADVTLLLGAVLQYKSLCRKRAVCTHYGKERKHNAFKLHVEVF